ncbi:MAG: Holliday junction resolvase RuvX [Acidimicrobiia bacterium]|nr:Holliday junction resolvase RuvX [Acidimicrobiia bacterium]
MGRILGIDPGTVRIGIAISDPTGTIASPHGYVDRRSRDVVSAIREIRTELDVDLVVVGLPINLDGTEGSAARASRALGAQLEGDGAVVVYHDERFTTVTAEDALIEGGVRRESRKAKRDQVAAAVMLQGYLDARTRDDRPGDASGPTP